MFEQILNNENNLKTFSKGEVLQRAGQETSKIFLVKEGILRSYIIDSKGKEHIYMFGSEGWIVSDIESQTFECKTVLFIEAIEESEVYVMNQRSFDHLKEKDNGFDALVASLSKRIGAMQRRILALMSSSARDRYESFLQIYPELPSRVPQKMIASYLGITPEALSTIRKKIAQGE